MKCLFFQPFNFFGSQALPKTPRSTSQNSLKTFPQLSKSPAVKTAERSTTQERGVEGGMNWVACFLLEKVDRSAVWSLTLTRTRSECEAFELAPPHPIFYLLCNLLLTKIFVNSIIIVRRTIVP